MIINNLKILFDHQIFVHPYGGASRYFVEVIDWLDANSKMKIELPLLLTQNLHLKEKKIYRKTLIDKLLDIKYKYSISNYLQILNQWNVKRQLQKGNFDIFHPTYYDPYYLEDLGEKPYVITVYDMMHELGFVKGTPQYVLDQKRLTIEKATKIVAISQNTKDDLVRLLNIAPEKIEVIYLATDFEATPIIKSATPYILFTGNRVNYKNFTLFIQAVAPLLLENDDLILKMTGVPLSADEIELLSTLGVQNKVEMVRMADEKRLMELYSNALCFVFPSLYEGFGVPLLEAFACECPMAISRASCFPEVAGDAALYFDPLSIDDIRATVKQLIDNEGLRRDLIEKGKTRLKDFSWEKTSKQHEILYQSL